MTSTTEAVLRYLSVVADLRSDEAELRACLTLDAVVVEHPNAIATQGRTRDLEAVVAGFLDGKALLSEQSIDVHEILVVDDRAAVRSTWRGTVGSDAGSPDGGTRLTAETAGFLTVRDGRVATHETFDCYGGAQELR